MMITDQIRINRLTEYVQGLMNKENGKELYLEYKEDIEKVTPQEVFEIFHLQLLKGSEPKDILVILDKVINIFYKSLNGYEWKKPEENSFMDYLMQENHALTNKLDLIKKIIKKDDFLTKKEELIPEIRGLLKFNDHYLKKENILFPYLEKKMKKFDGLAIMWALHDEARMRLNKVIQYLEEKDREEADINTALGDLFFAMYGLAQKEELILYPAASEVINENEWHEMQSQSLEYEFPFIEKPKHEIEEKMMNEDLKQIDSEVEFVFKTDTGELSFEQIWMIFSALPVDMSFVDENNKLKFFTKPKDRIFPRSPAAIGRDVKNCHPPESVHVVNEIIDSFRAGKKDTATFWIKVKGKMVLIQYFALRDSSGKFRGTLEVSQDITQIKMLEGEKRLLNWE